MRIDLSMEQVELLVELLEEKKRNLKIEIAHTSKREFRHALQHQEFVLEGMTDNVNEARASVLQECP